MFGARWRLFRLLGIPISLDASWLIILVLIVWSLVTLFRAVVPGLHTVEYWAMGGIAALAFFACILLHELGHAIVARARGMPIRGITLFLFGGVAEMEGEASSAGSEFLMAVAGPAVSALLVALFWGLSWAGVVSRWPVEVVVVFLYLAWINGAVLIFNLIPAFPLDGGRVLRSILWGILGDLRRATKWASLLGQGFAVLLIVFGVMQFVMDNVIGGLRLGLIGLFLRQAAESGYRQVLIREAPVRLFMTREPVSVPPSIDLKRWVEDYVYPQHRKFFPVMSDGRLEGVIETQALAKSPGQEWDRHTVAEVMHHDVNAVRIAPETDALKALGQMQRTGSSRLLVTDGDRLVGIISLKDLLAFLDQKFEFADMER